MRLFDIGPSAPSLADQLEIAGYDATFYREMSMKEVTDLTCALLNLSQALLDHINRGLG